MDSEATRSLAQIWETHLTAAEADEVARILGDVIEAVRRFDELDLEGVAPHVVPRAEWR